MAALFTRPVLRNIGLLSLLLLVQTSRSPWRPQPPTPLEGQLLVEEALALAHDERKLVLLDRAVLLDPDCVRAHNERALVLERLERYDDALVGLDRALRLEPDAAALHFNRGNVLVALDRIDLAREAYSRAIELDPDDPTFIEARAAIE